MIACINFIYKRHFIGSHNVLCPDVQRYIADLQTLELNVPINENVHKSREMISLIDVKKARD